MKTRTTVIIALTLAAFLGGCIVYSPPDPDGPDFYRPATPHTRVQVTHREFVHSDMEWVLWEYYDWDYDVVYNLHYRYNYTNDEVALILFLAYYGRVEPVRIVQWRQSGIPWMTITTYNLRLQPDIFFVPVSPAYRFGPPYGNAYGRYWKNPKAVVLTDSEMVNLVYLKTTCLAYNASPVEVIKLHEQGRDFNQIVWVHRSEGRHIKTARGREVREPPDRVKIRPMEHNKPGRDKDKDKPETGPEKGKPGLRPAAGDMTGGNDEQPKADEKPKTDKDKPKAGSKPSKDKGKPKGSDKPKTDDKGGKGKK
ncbi:MAG: hypothetical protein AAB038_00745 [Planctomycetota bacterium]